MQGLVFSSSFSFLGTSLTSWQLPLIRKVGGSTIRLLLLLLAKYFKLKVYSPVLISRLDRLFETLINHFELWTRWVTRTLLLCWEMRMWPCLLRPVDSEKRWREIEMKFRCIPFHGWRLQSPNPSYVKCCCFFFSLIRWQATWWGKASHCNVSQDVREQFNAFITEHPNGKMKKKDFGEMMKKV